MVQTLQLAEEQESPRRSPTSFGQASRWTSLHYFGWFRVVVAVLLCINAYLPAFGLIKVGKYSVLYQDICIFYLIAVFIFALALPRMRIMFGWQLTAQVLLDIFALTVLMYVDEGIRSGLATLLLVSLAGAGLVGHGRLVLFYAACATIAVLTGESLQSLRSDFLVANYLQAAYLCVGFFVTAIIARLIGHRVLENEALAQRRGVALHDQIIISQRVIEEMQDGVLVVAQEGLVSQHNPPAARFLALKGKTNLVSLSDCSSELFESYLSWVAGEGPAIVDFKVAANGVNLRARFVPTVSSQRDFLIFLEDMDRVQEAAQQIKLAALGRLTGSIAHEVRNPLSSISHATELLGEERRAETQGRLLRIIRDNSARIGRIITDVLQLGRRDHAFTELLQLSAFLEQFVDEFVLKEDISRDLIEVSCPIAIRINFDRVHLDQILWNLVRNGLRHGSAKPGSIKISANIDLSRSSVEIHVIDDGPGIIDKYHKQLFEPFFTTHTKGTGLGLYLARELCGANNAELDFIPGESGIPGAHFRITVRDNYVASSQ